MTAIPLSAAARVTHEIKHDRLLKGHRIVVEGFYMARAALRSPNGGASEKRRVRYAEVFILAPHEHRVHGQGALGHILSDEALAKRLSEKDADFRAIQTHVISKHENLWESDEEYAARHAGSAKAKAGKAKAGKAKAAK